MTRKNLLKYKATLPHFDKGDIVYAGTIIFLGILFFLIIRSTDASTKNNSRIDSLISVCKQKDIVLQRLQSDYSSLLRRDSTRFTPSADSTTQYQKDWWEVFKKEYFWIDQEVKDSVRLRYQQRQDNIPAE